MSKYAKLILVLIFVTIGFVSCKNEEQENAEITSEDYTKFVDSVRKIATLEALANWQSIQTDLEKAKNKVAVSAKKVSKKTSLQSSIDKVYIQFGEYKNAIMAEKYKGKSVGNKNSIRTALFWNTFVADNMTFDWVNKSNIHSVYENFITTLQKNKSSYSREDWDEIKVLYEALDARKNVVEKQGLTNSDNNKITLLKLKFAKMYAFNRLGAKSQQKLNKKSS